MVYLDIYGAYGSAPCRAVLLAAKALGVPVNFKHTEPHTPQIQTPDFIKMNPQKTIPTMDDSGFYLNESRAILQYLANKYGKGDKLYPKVPNERALVDSRLYFDMGTLYSRFGEVYYPFMFRGVPITEESLKRLDEGLEYLEIYLKDGYVAGGELTIADFAVIASLSTIQCVGHPLEKFPRILSYLEKCKKEMKGYEEINQKGIDQFAAWYQSSIASHQSK